MILLVTNKRDLTTDYVVRELKLRGVSYVRLNTETLNEHRCSIGYDSIDDWKIGDINGKKVTSAYFRRPCPTTTSHPTLTEGESEYLDMEWLSFLKSIYYRLDRKWLSSPTNIALAEDKPRQLLLASSLGFNVPQGIITNDVFTVMARTANENLIAKPLRQALLKEKNESVVFTSQIPTLTPEYDESIGFAPSIYQQEISKKYDVRVTVVGDKVFPVAIWSQTSEKTKVDWRQGGRIDLLHEHIDIPDDLKMKCIRLVRSLNLRFGAIDLVCDLDGVS
ncbi:RimK family alpha-L-glutamate ligase [Vibrio sp. 10N.261.55.F4]|uniref:ATP-grasp domain-containing protein n=1 Tax=Vibrio sp. 10N.261.55.F4 TaxID=3229692 RepID=UPI003552EC0C